MPRKKKSKLTRLLDAIEKTLVQHAKQVVHEDNKKKRVKKKVILNYIKIEMMRLYTYQNLWKK